MSTYVDIWLSFELKQSDKLRVLAFGDPDFESWCPFPLAQLSIPRTVPVIVVAAPKVHEFHSDINKLYKYAFAQACTPISPSLPRIALTHHTVDLPGRIIDPSTVA